MPIRYFCHLVRRFFSSLNRKAPSPVDGEWATTYLSAKERALWSVMSHPDKRHSIAVAKMVNKQLPEDRTAVVAALLHDIGKVSVRSGILLRVLAGFTHPLVSTKRRQRWTSKGGALSRLADLIEYPTAGATLLAEAGSEEFVVRWAAQHHLRPDEWTVDSVRARVLRRADSVAG